ncbi:MAG: hypothetical protein M3229_04570 [Actinomycetota bacterium]|nr:hypothetical protein [Actinomycetota bacterium]
MIEDQDPAAEAEPSGGNVTVVVRLVDGDRIEAGIFADEAEARRSAEGLIAALAAADSGWPLVEDRYVRPEAVVSVDLVREAHPRWTGSTGRAAPWSNPQAG